MDRALSSGLQGLEPSCSARRTLGGRTYSRADRLDRTIDREGKAYQAKDGSVYFNVGSFEGYGCLSRLADREIRASDASRESSDEYDRDSAADFALWKARRPEDGDNFWESPWGEGRPGWHIECSAICMKHLGESFDLHSGGVDLVFPHHENEIAQVEAVTDKTFARHWFHIAHLMVEGQKMSKSLGNLHTVAELAERGYKAREVRFRSVVRELPATPQLHFRFNEGLAPRPCQTERVRQEI